MQRESAWMGLADISFSLGSHHDPKISAPPPGGQNTNPIRREGGTSLDVINSAQSGRRRGILSIRLR